MNRTAIFTIASLIMFSLCLESPTGEETTSKTLRIIVLETMRDAVPTSYLVAVQNDTTKSYSLVWDKSVFIKPNGESKRIIRGKTPKIAATLTQPQAMIPAGAHINESFVWEGWTEWKDPTYDAADVTLFLESTNNLVQEFLEQNKEPLARVIFTFEDERKKTTEVTLVRISSAKLKTYEENRKTTSTSEKE